MKRPILVLIKVYLMQQAYYQQQSILILDWQPQPLQRETQNVPSLDPSWIVEVFVHSIFLIQD